MHIQEIVAAASRLLEGKVEAAKQEFWRQGVKQLGIMAYSIHTDTHDDEIILVARGKIGSTQLNEIAKMESHLAGDIADLRKAIALLEGIPY